MTPRLNRAAFAQRTERVLAGTEPSGPSLPDHEPLHDAEWDTTEKTPAPTFRPSATAGAAALKQLHDQLMARVPGQAVAMVPLLSALLRALYLLIPGFPLDDVPTALRGFPVTPPRTLDELDALLNCIEDILLLKLGPDPTSQTEEQTNGRALQ